MDKYADRVDPNKPRRDMLGWAERKCHQIFSMSLLAAGTALVAVGTYVLFNLLTRVFGVLDKLLQTIGRCLP